MNYNDLENFRLEYKNKIDGVKKKAITIWLIVISMVFFFGGVSILISGGKTLGQVIQYALFFCLQSGFFIGFTSVIVVLFRTKDAGINYRKAYKAYFVSDALSKTFTDYHFNSEKGLSELEIQQTRMMTTGDQFSSNDLVTGKYKDISFKQSDVHIEEEHTDSDGHTTYSTIFKGRWIIFDFKKKLDKKLAVVGENFKGATVGKHFGFKGIELESSEFNKHFNVYAQDGFEAYYVLDPAFMERVMHLAERYDDKIYLAFSDGQLHIGIYDGKDSFEPPSYKVPINEQAELKKVKDDIKVITDIVDEIKLVK